MSRQNTLCLNWHFLLVGLLFIIMQCDARAVNVSNTWTMPQEGLNVFYRFFRDRISWFEADAVCQFHHANLVTVDNSFQFDATRDLLRELDVNDIVWIGLMRPQSSDRFMWSNSRPLVADTGYWAESLPLMDAPLCAVIDPIRDYRWHALRCGGPETASFLCEMPVPSWADACNLKDMPNLTLQYMADTASIELIRNCQEEGLLRTMCRGKQDRERALQDLICPRERLEAQRINDITNSHFKSLQIINSIPSDNNENNDIELLPMEVNYGPHYPEELQTEKNTVQRLIEQFNVDELMQADEPSNMETVSSFYKISGLIPKPVKKSTKKVLEYPKKEINKPKIIVEPLQKDKKRLPLEMEDVMMGDQPFQGEPELPEQILNDEVSNEILEPLPHIKKTNLHKEDGLEKIEKEATAIKKSMQLIKENEMKKMLMVVPSITTTTSSPISISTTNMPLTTTPAVITHKFAEETSTTEEQMKKFNADNSWGHLITTTPAATIEHPIHPQQPHNNFGGEEAQHSYTKESADSSHFIPPMLMVKSHYVPPTSKHGHSEHDHYYHHEQQQQQQQQQHKNPNEQKHLESTTEEKAGTTIKHEETQNLDTTMMSVVTTSKVLVEQETTLNTFAAAINPTNKNETKQNAIKAKKEQHPVALTTNKKVDGSIKPIIEQQEVKEMEQQQQRENSKNLYFQDKETTMTAKLVPSADTTIAETTEKINKNNVGHEHEKDKEKQDLKQPQTTTAAETTQATKLVTTTEKSLRSTEKLYNLETATDSIEKEIAEPEIIQTQTQQHHMLTIADEKLTGHTTMKTEENKEHLQTTTGTTAKLNVAKKSQVITASTTALAPTTQQQEQLPTTIKPETHSLEHIQIDQTDHEQLREKEKQKEQDKKETIVKATEILVAAATAQEKLAKKEEEEEAAKEKTIIYTTKPLSTTTETITSKAAVTTIKPITTILPQTEVKSTETSVSSTGAFITTTKAIAATTAATTNIAKTTAVEENTSTRVITSPTTRISSSTAAETEDPSSSSPPPAAVTLTSLIKTNAALAKATREARTEAENLTSTSTSMPYETTRNFLKVTTEMPFKPNRRRTLTKPETVSYMKKILG